jgi:ATP-dependent helicase HrpA
MRNSPVPSDSPRAQRRAALGEIHYPPGLPVSEHVDEIATALRRHQVVIVAGETGSGKTTQLPKICLDLGRGVAGMIGHTQPRRIAARAVAERIAFELGSPLGAAVGYKVRFTDQASSDTLVKVMTDGILLAELQRDRLLRAYDTIIVDEAHERSLNIDFILGYLKQLLPRRRDLKVVVTSATIDPQRFSRHFGGAPVVEVSGRMFPVEIRYRPLVDESGGADVESSGSAADTASDDSAEPRDQITAVCDAVDELCREGPGDVLVFLSGEREIRDTAEALLGRVADGVEVVPLYARLSSAEQHRVFAPHAGRRVVLATNVAETSLTVPGIRYVVDAGTARISRYSHRTKVQRLPIEPVSQASANQRAGRCGRVEAGVCIRLYSEADYAGRPRFTDPEILRTNLASVIVQMAAARLGDISTFPFVEPPDRRAIKDGVALLEELRALESASGTSRLTPIGRKIAALPVDPRLARMIVEAGDRGCVDEIVVIAGALSIVDPRERPVDRREQADAAQLRFSDPESDLIGYLNLWNYVREQQRALSSSRFRRLCRTEFLNYQRIREWQDVVSQLRQVARSVGIRIGPPGSDIDRTAIHRCVLAGMLSHIGMRDPVARDYIGARNARFAVFPGSALFKKQPRWIVAAELVETGRLWGRQCARIEPDWIEPLAAHLVKRTYSEPHWDARSGAVIAYEKVLLYGVPIVESRRIGYAHVDPVVARELFIRNALVEGDWRATHRFLGTNANTLREVEALENRVRRRDLAVGDEALFAWYDERIPADVVSARHFDSWWKRARRETPDLLTFSASDVMTQAVDAAGFPPTWRAGDLELPLGYVFEPAADDDGVTVSVPLGVANQIGADAFSWHVPGFRRDVVAALIRSLPKNQRRHFVPAADVARDVVSVLQPGRGSLEAALAHELTRRAGIEVAPDDFAIATLPAYLRMRIAVVDDNGEVVAAGRDVAELMEKVAPTVRATLTEAAAALERHGLRDWPDDVPTQVETVVAGRRLVGFPALVDEGDAVGVRVFEDRATADAAMRRGLRRLLLLGLPSPAKALQRTLPNSTKLALARESGGRATALLDDCLTAVLDDAIGAPADFPRTADAFARLRESARRAVPSRLPGVVDAAVSILATARALEARVSSMRGPQLLPALLDVKTQLSGLTSGGFVTGAATGRLADVARYLTAIERRLDKLPADVAADTARMWQVEQAIRAWDDARERRPDDDRVAAVRWLIEEFRVSLFAQTLGTAQPVSLPRIRRALDDATNS